MWLFILEAVNILLFVLEDGNSLKLFYFPIIYLSIIFFTVKVEFLIWQYLHICDTRIEIACKILVERLWSADVIQTTIGSELRQPPKCYGLLCQIKYVDLHK